MNITNLRRHYHARICSEIIRVSPKDSGPGYPNFADGASPISSTLAWGIVRRLGFPIPNGSIKPQTVGMRFEVATKNFLEQVFPLLAHLRPGEWHYSCENTDISRFDQYSHLAEIERIFSGNKTLESSFGGSYIVQPDIVVSRRPVSDVDIDRNGLLTGKSDVHASLTPLRSANHTPTVYPILHAVVSCKWTTRNDRAQNTRTEVLNLIRNRKGNLPHVVAVTAEPFPSRIAALALGTGDLDCVYHFALPELIGAVEESNNGESQEILTMMIEGRRLRDISDLPFDLAV